METPQAVDPRSRRNSIAAVGYAACLILAGSLGRPGTGKTIAGGSALGECCGSRVMPAESALQEPFGAFLRDNCLAYLKVTVVCLRKFCF